MNLTPVIKDSFLQFSGAVLQSRALIDVRDCIKPSARQIFYCLYTDKFVHSKPFQKTLKAIGSAFRMYIHGDSSAEGIIMRAGQPFSMRYPLIEVEGSYGTLLSSGSWAAPRYTASRLSPLAEYLFKDIEKNTITEWRDNYDDTEQYPMVLPSKGFFNIVNGSYGIGVGMSSSVPQYNLKELNNALIKLLWNPDISFDGIYCAPDFATGATILNAEEVKESHRNGRGKACKIRSTIEWDSKERCLNVVEIPYMLYTETICKELENILNSEENPGIERFNDLTGEKVCIKIYLNKRANPDKVIKYLYKKTSLQNHYSINFTMLENGRFPKVFTWKEILQAHLDHEKEVYRQGFIYDLNKIKARLHIIEGLLKAINNIDEVIRLIKEAADSKNASLALQKFLRITEIQAKAILDIKLARLARLEVDKLINEQKELEAEKDRITSILMNEDLLKKEIEKGLIEVANKFGDERRTKILNIEAEEDEPKEIKSLSVNLTNNNNVYINEISSLYTQRKGGVGVKFKLDNGEFILNSFSAQTIDTILFFTNYGNFYSCNISILPVDEKVYINNFVNLRENERIVASISINKNNNIHNLTFITKCGMIKKSSIEEYNIKRQVGVKALNLNEGDELCDVLTTDSEKIGILTNLGQFLMFVPRDISETGRVTKGVKAIKLNNGDYVVSARVVPKTTKEIISITHKGLSKRSNIKDFSIGSRYTKGQKIQKLKDSKDNLVDFLPIEENCSIIVVSNKTQLKITTDSINLLSKDTYGAKSIKMDEKNSVVKLLKC